MNEEIQKARSPNSPKLILEAAIETTSKLLEKIGRSSVDPLTAVNAIGYGGLNGASLTTLGALSHYGLIEREGGQVTISALAFKILHPVNSDQKAQAIKEAALKPMVFSKIHEKWSDMEIRSLANTLIHNDFTPEGAKRAASVWRANYLFANLGHASNSVSDDETHISPGTAPTRTQTTAAERLESLTNSLLHPTVQTPSKVLATFRIPLGSSEAELIFTGEKLEANDFDDLKEYVDLFKRQYERKVKNLAPSENATQRRNYPTKAIWNGKNVTVLGPVIAADGARYYELEGHQARPPETEIQFV